MIAMAVFVCIALTNGISHRAALFRPSASPIAPARMVSARRIGSELGKTLLSNAAPASPPRAPSRSRASAVPVQISHAGAVQVDEEESAVKWQRRAPTEYQLNLGTLIDSLRSDYPLLFVEPQDLSLFDDAVELHGPSGQRLSGIGPYTAVLRVLRFSRRVAMDDAELTHRITVDGRSVRVRWSAKLWIKDPTLGLTSFQQEPVLVNVDGVSRYDLDGKGFVYLHALENIVMSGPDTNLLEFPSLELMWQLPALVCFNVIIREALLTPLPEWGGLGGLSLLFSSPGTLL